MGQNDTDFKKIKKLIEIMKANDLVEVEIKHGEDKIYLKRRQAQEPTVIGAAMLGSAVSAATDAQGPSAAQAQPPEAGKDDGLIEIKSPIVGTFYATPSPDSDAFVDVGSNVSSQTVVCIIEAMKVMNEIKAETTGAIAEILVSNGQAVEYGQVLFKVRAD